MTESTTAKYRVAERTMIVETPELRVQDFKLAAGDEIPWHHHTVISDTFYCLEGPMVVNTKADDGGHTLQAGEKLTISPHIAHRVAGQDDGPCRFILVQETGTYDLVMLDD